MGPGGVRRTTPGALLNHRLSAVTIHISFRSRVPCAAARAAQTMTAVWLSWPSFTLTS
jgi:hypothetical protein